MDTYPRSLPPDVHVSSQHGLGVNQNRQDCEASNRSLANQSLRKLRHAKPTAQWRALLGFGKELSSLAT
jgi:hypothetical protein